MRLLTLFVLLLTTELNSVFAEHAGSDSSTIRNRTDEKPNFTCRGRGNGIYPSACANFLYACASETVHEMPCPEGLVSSSLIGKCVYPEECHQSTIESGSVVSSTLTPAEGYFSAPTKSADFFDDAHLYGGDCRGKSNGLYGANCTSEYLICADEIGTAQQCPEGTVFDQVPRKCAFLSDCLRQQTSGDNSSCAGNECVSLGTPKDEPVAFNDLCIGRVDGIFSAGCVREYFRCYNNRTFPGQCPEGYVFDQASQLCDFPEKCGEQRVESSTILTTSSTTLPPTTASCAEDEFIAIGICKKVFRRCRNGAFSVAICPNSSYFDETVGHCIIGLAFCLQRDMPTSVSIVATTPAVISPAITPVHQLYQPFYHHPREPVTYSWQPVNSYGFYPPYNPEVKEVLPTISKDAIMHSAQEDSDHFSPNPPPSVSTTPSVDDQFDHDHKFVNLDEVPFADDEIAVGRSRRSLSSQYGAGSGSGSFAPFGGVCANGAGAVMSSGWCSAEYVYCRSVSQADRAICPIGDLFDTTRGRCREHTKCGQSIVKPMTATVANKAPLDDKQSYATPQKSAFSDNSKTPSNYGRVSNYLTQSPIVRARAPANSLITVTVQTPMPLSTSAPSVRCSRPFGLQAMGCSKEYISCVAGIPTLMHCSEPLVFNEMDGICDYRRNVVACGEVLSNTVPPQPIITSTTEETTSSNLPPFPTLISGQNDGMLPESDSSSTPELTTTTTVSDISSNGSTLEAVHKSYSSPPHGQNRHIVEQLLEVPTEEPLLSAPMTALVQDPCSGRQDGYSAEDCSAAFLVCQNGLLNASMTCPLGSLFNRDSNACVPSESMPECNPVSDHIMPSCSFTSKAVGECSEQYLHCVDGVETVEHCPTDQVFNPPLLSCERREFVDSCSSISKSAPLTTGISTIANQTTCSYNASDNVFATEFCSNRYIICSEEGILSDMICPIGLLFDIQMKECVSSATCGLTQLSSQNATFEVPTATIIGNGVEDTDQAVTDVDPRCDHVLDGGRASLGACNQAYITCRRGVAYEELCTAHEVFSSVQGRCVNHSSLPECTRPRFSSGHAPLVSRNASTFCASRNDGLYRNPANCAGVLQCFGGDLFEYPGCSSGLAFNEQKRMCDYIVNVPECFTQVATGRSMDQTDTGCNGIAHGGYTHDAKDCTKFYRCVHNQLVVFACPQGTLFNPLLAICDWPENVNCAMQ